MWIVRTLLWGVVGAIFGIINGAALYWAFDWDITRGALVGAVVAGSAALTLGLVNPGTKTSSGRAGRAETRYSFQRCAWCRGSGRIGRAKKQCNVCYGQGSVLTEQPPRRCPKCKGKGKLALGRKCKVCFGAGWERYGYLETTQTPRQSRRKSRTAL